MVGKVWVNGHWYKVSYEGLHIICSSCGCYGHLGRNCKKSPPKEQATPPETTVTPPAPEMETEKGSTQNEKIEAEREEAKKAIPEAKDIGDIHGEWLVVTRRKRAVLAQREQAKNKGGVPLSNRYEKSPTNSKVVGHVGYKAKGSSFNAIDPKSNVAPDSDNKGAKNGWKIKKRRHDEGPTIQPTNAVPMKVKTADPRPTQLRNENPKEVREMATPQKLASENRRPLQESSKQNIITISSESAAPLKGFKTAMQIEQISNNHFQFTEENIPPNDIADSMEVMEEGKEIDNSNMVVTMQEDANMNVGVSTQPNKG